MKRLLSIGIILLFVGLSISSSTGYNLNKESTITPLDGKTLYVGGNGTGNYSKIQDAIDDAYDGDTVFVYNGTYYENVVINKSINLIGESKEYTIIDIDKSYINIFIQSDGVTVSGFTLQDSNESRYSSGIAIMANSTIIKHNLIYSRFIGIALSISNNNTIFNNKIFNNGSYGFYISDSSGNNISNNHISNYDKGFEIWFSDNNKISKNSLSNHSYALNIYASSGNLISNNSYNYNSICFYLHYSDYNDLLFNNIKGVKDIFSDDKGIHFEDSNHNMIRRNRITNYKFGILLEDCITNIIEKNTFLNNIVSARFHNNHYTHNIWSENYWNRPRFLPKPIFGIKRIDDIIPRFFEFDMNPASEPYDIEV